MAICYYFSVIIAMWSQTLSITAAGQMNNSVPAFRFYTLYFILTHAMRRDGGHTADGATADACSLPLCQTRRGTSDEYRFSSAYTPIPRRADNCPRDRALPDIVPAAQPSPASALTWPIIRNGRWRRTVRLHVTRPLQGRLRPELYSGHAHSGAHCTPCRHIFSRL